MAKAKSSSRAQKNLPRRQMPWEYSGAANIPAPGKVPNVPSAEGAEIGEYLAAFADAEYQKTGHDARCEDCAFRLGTYPNQCLATVADALKCVLEGETFDCHVHKQVCEGYAMLRAAENGV